MRFRRRARRRKRGRNPPNQKDAEKKPGAPEPVAIDVAGYAPSPDGKWLAVWAKDPETPGEKKQKDAKADAVWVNHEVHLTRLYLAALKPDGSIDGALEAGGRRAGCAKSRLDRGRGPAAGDHGKAE